MHVDYLAEAEKWLEHVKMLANEKSDDEFYWKRLKMLEWLVEKAKEVQD